MFDLFYKNSPLRGSLSAVLVITTIFLAGGWILFYPKPAQATLPTIDVAAIARAVFDSIMFVLKWVWEKIQAAYNAAANWITAGIKAWEKSESILAKAAYIAAQIALHTLLNMLTNDIIKWIQDGGEPRFISNWEGFLKSAGNKAGGLFVDKYLGAGWLCEPFDIAIKIPLLKVPTFDERVRCTLEDMGINIRMFLDDFEEGGWAGWIELTKPQGNFYGGYLIAQTEKINREQAAKDAAGQEGGAGRGFLSVKVCVKGYTEDYDTGETDETCSGSGDCGDLEDSVEDDINYLFVCEKEEVSTPASVLSDVTSRAIDRPMESLSRQVADLTDSMGSYAPYIIAISNALINRVIEEGLAEVQRIGPTEEEPDIPLPTGTPVEPMQTPAQAGTDAGNAATLFEQQGLLKENIETQLLPQQQSNLGIMQNIETIQNSILTTLGILFQLSGQPNCSLPSWANSQMTDEWIEPTPDPATQTNKTIKIFQITVDDVGSISIKKSTWQQWHDCAYRDDEDRCVGDWVPFTFYETLEKTTQITDEVTAMEEDISSTNLWIDDIATAIISTDNFIDEANEYIALYDATPQPPTEEEQDALDAKIDAVEIAKESLINDGQIAVQSSEEDIFQLVIGTTDKSYGVLNTTNDLLDIRGVSESHAEAGTLYAQKNSVKDKLSSAQNIYSVCTAPPPENGNGNGE